MQKVISINSYTNAKLSSTTAHVDPNEQEYPELNKALAEGWRIKETITVQGTGHNVSYTVIFILDKGSGGPKASL